jgi:hypothetical protein
VLFRSGLGIGAIVDSNKKKAINAIETPKGLGMNEKKEEIKPPTPAEKAVEKAAEKQRKRAAASAYQNIKTTPRGLGTSANIRKKVMLGE